MDLEGYFKLNFSLMQYHKYSLTEIENMMPWERDIYVQLLKNHLDEEQEKQRQERMDEIPEGLEDLLNSIRGEGKLQQSSALAVIPKGSEKQI